MTAVVNGVGVWEVSVALEFIKRNKEVKALLLVQGWSEKHKAS